MFKTLSISILFFLIFINFLNAQISYSETGLALKQSNEIKANKTYSGEYYNPEELSASHLTLPFGSVIKVSNVRNNKFILAKVNHRGPFTRDAIVSLSDKAWDNLKLNDNRSEVKIEYVGATEIITEPESDSFFLVDATRVKPEGFGIQIAYLDFKKNVFALTDNLKNEFDKDVIIQVLSYDEPGYKVLVGNFGSFLEAKKYREKLLSQYPDCFIVDFSKL